MKSILVIGIGRFGKHLCMDLVKNGNDVMAVDDREENLEDILSLVTSAKIADCTREEVLRSFGVRNFEGVGRTICHQQGNQRYSG